MLLGIIVYFSWNYSIKVIKDQRVHSIVLAAGTPYGFFNVYSGVLVRVVVPVINPSSRVMVFKQLIAAGVEIPLNDTILNPGERIPIDLGWSVLRSYNITVANFVENTFIEGTLVLILVV